MAMGDAARLRLSLRNTARRSRAHERGIEIMKILLVDQLREAMRSIGSTRDGHPDSLECWEPPDDSADGAVEPRLKPNARQCSADGPCRHVPKTSGDEEAELNVVDQN